MTVTTSVSKEKDAAKNEIASFSAKAAKLKNEGDAHFGKRKPAHVHKLRPFLTSYSGVDATPGDPLGTHAVETHCRTQSDTDSTSGCTSPRPRSFRL